MATEKQVQVWSKDKLLEYTQNIVSLDVAIRGRYEIRGKLLTQIEENEKKIREQPKLEELYKQSYPEGSKALKTVAIISVCMCILILIALGPELEHSSDALWSAVPMLFVLGIPVLIYVVDKMKRMVECSRIDDANEMEREEVNEKNREIKKRKEKFNEELKKDNDRNQKAIAVLEEDIETLDQRRNELASWNVFPSMYTKAEAMAWFYEYFASDRVDTVREAINLYAQESQMLRIEGKLDQLTNEMQEIAYTQSALYRQLIASTQAMASTANIQTTIMKDSMERLNQSQKMIEYYQEMNYINQKYK